MRKGFLIAVLVGLFAIVGSWYGLSLCKTIEAVNCMANLTITGAFLMFFGTVLYIQNVLLEGARK